MYLIIKKVKYASANWKPDFSVVNQSEDLQEAEKYLKAYQLLKKEDETYCLVQFQEPLRLEPDRIVKDQNFDYQQLELPFGVSSL